MLCGYNGGRKVTDLVVMSANFQLPNFGISPKLSNLMEYTKTYFIRHNKYNRGYSYIDKHQ